MSDQRAFTPREVVSELDRYIVGQREAKRAVAIALTAFARSEDRAQALAAGFLVHLSKPVEASELVTTVARVFKGERAP